MVAAQKKASPFSQIELPPLLRVQQMHRIFVLGDFSPLVGRGRIVHMELSEKAGKPHLFQMGPHASPPYDLLIRCWWSAWGQWFGV